MSSSTILPENDRDLLLAQKLGDSIDAGTDFSAIGDDLIDLLAAYKDQETAQIHSIQPNEIAGHIGALDIGQAAIVARGIVLGVESVEGTDAMLARVGELSEEVRGTPDARAGVLAKIPKPQQDRRIDLPALGPQTIAGAARTGLAGIVFEADGVLFEAPDACIEQANRAGLFLYGLTPDEL